MSGHVQCDKHTKRFPELGARVEYFRHTRSKKIHITIALWVVRIYIFI